MLAYNPPGSGEEGYLFCLAWLNHNFNSIYITQDAEGPAAARPVTDQLQHGAARRHSPPPANALLEHRATRRPACRT